jgi:hypothetical protein
MWRLAYSFIGAMTITALSLNAISVYLLHDVDADRVGQWNLAYLELCVEFLILAAVVGIVVLALTGIGRILLRLQGIPPSPKLAFFLGILLILAQYPIEFAARKYFPDRRDIVLMVYPFLGSIVCAALILRDNFAKMPRSI